MQLRTVKLFYKSIKIRHKCPYFMNMYDPKNIPESNFFPKDSASQLFVPIGILIVPISYYRQSGLIRNDTKSH